MPDRKPAEVNGFVVESYQALIALPEGENGQEVTGYFRGDEAADNAQSQTVTLEALKAVGAWRDLDWQEMEEALDRIRHESVPTPPIEL